MSKFYEVDVVSSGGVSKKIKWNPTPNFVKTGPGEDDVIFITRKQRRKNKNNANRPKDFK